jgi:hypothetical protein
MGFNQFQIIANQTELDTYEDFNVSLNYQITDITDITTRTTSFSKTIILPGTPKNNEFFKNIFELNIDIGISSYNPKIAVPVSVLINYEEVFVGNLQLLRIITNQNFVEYEIIITGVLKNLLFNLSDFYLDELDFSEYNHRRNITSIQNSWNYIIRKNGFWYDATGFGEGYVYPFINYANSSNAGTETLVYDMYPAIYVKTIMDKLFEYTNYTYTSTFFNTDYFKSLIIPFTNDKLQYSDEELKKLTNVVGVDATQPEYNPILKNSLSAYNSNAGVTGYIMITPVLKRVWLYSNSYRPGNELYYFPLLRQTGNVLGTELQNPDGRWNPLSSKYRCTESGYYDINFEMTFVMKYIHRDALNIEYNSGLMGYCASIVKQDVNGVWRDLQTAPYPDFCQTRFAPSPGVHSSPWYDLQTELSISMSIPNVYLEFGEQIAIKFNFYVPSNLTWKGFNNDDKIYMTALIKNNQFGSSANYLEVKPSSNTITNPNIVINMNQILPKMRMRDFFLSIVKMFNLVVMDNPNDVGDIIIEPRDMFYNSRKKIKDWTPILDEKFDVIQVPMSELDVTKYEFKYQDDDDYINKKYTEETQEIYSNTSIEFLNDFSTEVKDISVSFAPTPVTDLYLFEKVAPFFADVDSSNIVKPKKVKPRILFYTGLKSGEFLLKNSPSSTNTSVYSQYPYCGMWDEPRNAEYDLGFGLTKKIYWNSPNYPENTLVNQFYKTTLNEIQDVNSKLVIAYFYLTPTDIKEFDFRDIILLNNGYYRVNKIQDYAPNALDRTTKVELFRITDIDFYNITNQTLPGSNFECPSDIVAVGSALNFIYISLSGRPITPECCRLINGNFIDGACRARRSSGGGGIGIGDGRDVAFGSGISNKSFNVPTFGPNISPVYSNRPVDLNKNNNSVNSLDTVILGSNVYVPTNINNVITIGNNIVVNPDVSNAIVIGDNISVDCSDSVTVGCVTYTNEGMYHSQPYVIDGGEDTVMNIEKTNLIDVIDGGFNSVRNYDGDSKLRVFVEGSSPDESL